MTGRALALAVVLLVLTISFANSLRIYFAQSSEIAATKAEIAQREQRIADLESELDRWEDPAYVKLQARARLGWVVPGETSYRVVDADGNPIGGGAEIGSAGAPLPPATAAWWTKLWGSVETADRPAPVQEKKKDTPITESTKPAAPR